MGIPRGIKTWRRVGGLPIPIQLSLRVLGPTRARPKVYGIEGDVLHLSASQNHTIPSEVVSGRGSNFKSWDEPPGAALQDRAARNIPYGRFNLARESRALELRHLDNHHRRGKSVKRLGNAHIMP